MNIKNRKRIVKSTIVIAIVACILLIVAVAHMPESTGTTTTPIPFFELTKYFNMTPLPCKPAWVKSGDWLGYEVNVKVRRGNKEINDKIYVKVVFTNVSFNVFEVKSFIHKSSNLLIKDTYDILLQLFRNETLRWRVGDFIYIYPHRLPINNTISLALNGVHVIKRHDRVTGILVKARVEYLADNKTVINLDISLNDTNIKILNALVVNKEQSLIQYLSLIVAAVIVILIMVKVKRR